MTEKVRGSVKEKQTEEDVIEDIVEENEIEQEIEIIEEKQEEEKNIVQSQQKLAETNFIGNKESKIINLLGNPQLSRIDGSVYTLRYDSDNCRLFLFFNLNAGFKRVEHFEFRNLFGELLDTKNSLESCYKEYNLIN